MANGGSGIEAIRPEAMSLKVNFKDFFKALSNGIGNVSTGKWWAAGANAIDLITAIKPKESLENSVFLLIAKSLLNALIELLGQHVDKDDATAQLEYDNFFHVLGDALAENEVTIDRRFIDRPKELPVLKDIIKVIRQWLGKRENLTNDPQSIVNQLPDFFVRALDREWRKNEETYRPILGALEGPFRKALERDMAWIRYAKKLQENAEEQVFGEPFGLKQLYVPLNAYYVEGDSRENQRRIVVTLEDEITQWLQGTKKEDAIRVISGGPGSGKSTFAKIFAARVTQKGQAKVIYIPLHMLNATKDFAEQIGKFVKAEGILTQNPLDLDSPEPDLLVILDGLDELAGQGKIAAEAAKAFVREVELTVKKYNLAEFRLRVLTSGRELVVQENETEFRRERQIITLLPYFLSDEDKEKYNDSGDILQHDLRHDWWKNYGHLKDKPYAAMPDELKRKDLDEITAQPLLNYLLALSYIRGKIDFSQEVNLNKIYNDLMDAVHGRECENRNFCMELKDFKRVLEEVGLAAWQSGEGRITTVREIEALCKESGLDKQLKDFMEAAEAGVTRLLAAFFFRKSGHDEVGDKTFVFTHKSFGEYLAACRIVLAIKIIVIQMQRRNENSWDGWSERDALVHWAKICGPNAISRYIHPFLLNEVRLHSRAEVESWQGCFTKLFNYALKNGMPMESASTESRKVDTFPKMLSHSRNAEEALLVALNACARVTEKISDIEHPTPETFGTWFKRIQGQRIWFENVLAARCLSFLNLKDANLCITHFSYANLSGADLSGANLLGANLIMADLSGANLLRTNLREASLLRTNLCKANLFKADLRKAGLFGANLSGANLLGANLSEANLRRADLRGVNLTDAKRSGADFTDAKFDETSVADTDLSVTYLTDVKFEIPPLDQESLERVKRLLSVDKLSIDTTGWKFSRKEIYGG
ncbi:MAG: pentapeptide repeat-containing protein [Nitrospirae bacterium]|uniref:pentapeptide repeat-containing protein n=1 Tax=Candidatus Magnetobacterium casense TaxID=1455061 RepID=UPI0006991654|nr:pentapeptide repeat-containing protein [Candidatus Magnetobacterium casensis]MBF0337035.1 pentapeptide repeat-containing protein [Nitrospirota bacterium]